MEVEDVPRGTSCPSSPVLEVFTQEVLVTDIERRKKGSRELMLLTCHIGGMESALPLYCWHRSMFDELMKSQDQNCAFGIVRKEKDGTWFYTIERIDQIGDVKFFNNEPSAAPTAQQIGF